MSELSVKTCKGLDNIPEAAALRKAVFVDEQGFENEFDDIDPKAWHAVLFEDDEPVAAGRLFDENGEAHIGRICVAKNSRGKGYGDKIMLSLEKTAKNNGYKTCALSAQTRVKGFYGKLGYECRGEEYLDEFCPHILMVKKL